MTERLKKIVIVGGGISGLELAKKLGKKLGKNKKAKIILVDRNQSYLWKPFLHKIATGSVDERIEEINYLSYAHNHYFQFNFGSMVDIVRKTKTITLSPFYDENGEILLPKRKLTYDTLVIALGSISNDFDIPGVKENCIFLDDLQQARYLHRRIFNLFLKHSETKSINTKINIVIVGGGATGVELSAELQNIVKYLIKYKYKKINYTTLNVTIIEARDRILPTLPSHVSILVQKKLIKLGIQILTKIKVINANEKGFLTREGKYIEADLMIWAAGVKVSNFMRNIDGLETNHINQLIVKPTLQTISDPDIFAIGDCASCKNLEGGFVPPRAQSAHQMANLVFYNILAQIKKEKLNEYLYKDYGSLITLSSFFSVGILKIPNNLIKKSITIKGCTVYLIYAFLYFLYQIKLHGFCKAILIAIASGINRITYPRLKLF